MGKPRSGARSGSFGRVSDGFNGGGAQTADESLAPVYRKLRPMAPRQMLKKHNEPTRHATARHTFAPLRRRVIPGGERSFPVARGLVVSVSRRWYTHEFPPPSQGRAVLTERIRGR